MAKKQAKKISEQIRRAIDESGLTRYRIAQLAEIDESALGKFYRGDRMLSLKALDRLGAVLNLEIVIRKSGKPKGK